MTLLTSPRPSSPLLAQAQEALQRHWGYQDFRPRQRKAILAALYGRDCLTLLPTGGGKSLCYQVPALVLPGLTIVVSPLISLMQDQVAALRARGVGAAYLSSTQTPELQRAVWEAVMARAVQLLYAAPERLAQLLPIAGQREISLLAVDEAHCISEWGHDFRPAYRSIGRLRAALGDPPTIAVTGTATPATREDIVRVLRLRRPVRAIGTFDRPNLRFEARRVSAERERFQTLIGMIGMLGAGGGSAIVYVPTRNRADAVAKVLRWRGFAAAPYHAALPPGARRALLSRFLDGRIRIIAATNAFGMGIDKPDVRLVAHLGIPPRPEAYYQEAGRAGRDGAPAHCVLFWTERDFALARLISARTATAPQEPPPPHVTAARRGLETMRQYVATRACRRAILLEYLGEKLTRCGGCDRCGERG
ncbi:MAG TPA: ATP-dependent DNA helicase RecQ [Gemmatimonadales bacterium]|nr:ATP-dependent DNA helicase RecQ [Gemmatimonadales bacterium]